MAPIRTPNPEPPPPAALRRARARFREWIRGQALSGDLDSLERIGPAGELDPEELEHIRRFRNPRRRRQAEAAIRLARRLLGPLLPGPLRIGREAGGRPRILWRGTRRLPAVLPLSLSHCGPMVACLAPGLRPAGRPAPPDGLGIDLEAVPPRCPDWAFTLFSASEADALERAEDRAGLFASLWTRKESLSKAAGEPLWNWLGRCVLDGPDPGPSGCRVRTESFPELGLVISVAVRPPRPSPAGEAPPRRRSGPRGPTRSAGPVRPVA